METLPPQGERPTWDSIWMNLAVRLSRRSTCHRAQVGSVLVTDDNTQVLSLGYNGGARGLQNGCLSLEPGKCGCAHAEMNSLVKADFNSPHLKKLYVTVEPCRLCSVLIINAHVSQVVYLNEYRVHDGLETLKAAGIKVRKMSPEELDIITEASKNEEGDKAS